MKRFLLIPSCALLSLSVLTSCQKEEKSALELTQELTAELQKVTDYRTAEASAARVTALNKRLQDATVRTVALNGTALLASDQGDAGAAYADATVRLARELGRVRSSVPVTTHDGEVDRERLIMSTGVAAGAEPAASPSARKSAGKKFIMHDADKSHEAPPEFEECYGSAKLKEALAYTADPAAAPIMKFDSADDVPAIPEPTPVPEEEPAADEPAADEEPAADTEEPARDEEPAADTEEPAADDGTDDATGDLGIDVGGDADSGDSSSSGDEEPAADDSSDDASGDDDGGLDIDIGMDDL